MPKKQALLSMEDRVAEAFLEEARSVAERIAAEDGPPPGAGKVGDTEAVKLYGQTDPNADYDSIYTALLTTGLPSEQFETLAISQERPEWAELYLQPAPDSQIAAYLATFAEFPWRPAAVLDYSDEPEEQVKRDEQLFKQWQKMLAEQDAGLMASVGEEESVVQP